MSEPKESAGQNYPSQPHPGTAQWDPPQAYPPQPQTQQQSANVVVVGAQPTAAPVVITQRPRAPDYLTLTIVGFILCFFFGGLLGMVLLVPALMWSLKAQNANDVGDYYTAKRLGQFSLCWNISIYVIYVLVTIGWVVGVTVWFVQFNTPQIIIGT